jgi:hypothetical protein
MLLTLSVGRAQSDENANWLCSEEDRVHAQGMSANEAIGLVRMCGRARSYLARILRCGRNGGECIHPRCARTLTHSLRSTRRGIFAGYSGLSRGSTR